MKQPLSEHDARQFADDLRDAYEVEDAEAFAAHVLGRPVALAGLTARERLDVQVAARAAYAPVQQALLARQAARVDALSPAQAGQEGAAWLGL